MSSDNRTQVCLRDRSCGLGGIHCRCCNRLSRTNRKKFARLVRTRVRRFVTKDLFRSPA